VTCSRRGPAPGIGAWCAAGAGPGSAPTTPQRDQVSLDLPVVALPQPGQQVEDPDLLGRAGLDAERLDVVHPAPGVGQLRPLGGELVQGPALSVPEDDRADEEESRHPDRDGDRDQYHGADELQVAPGELGQRCGGDARRRSVADEGVAHLCDRVYGSLVLHVLQWGSQRGAQDFREGVPVDPARGQDRERVLERRERLLQDQGGEADLEVGARPREDLGQADARDRVGGERAHHPAHRHDEDRRQHTVGEGQHPHGQVRRGPARGISRARRSQGRTQGSGHSRYMRFKTARRCGASNPKVKAPKP
jgi:hypothetical protein